MLYKCDKCDYTTHKKDRINTHINKLRPCSKQTVIVNREIMEQLNNSENKRKYIEDVERLRQEEADNKMLLQTIILENRLLEEE